MGSGDHKPMLYLATKLVPNPKTVEEGLGHECERARRTQALLGALVVKLNSFRSRQQCAELLEDFRQRRPGECADPFGLPSTPVEASDLVGQHDSRSAPRLFVAGPWS